MLTSAIEANDAYLTEKRRELQNLHAKNEAEREMYVQKKSDLNTKIQDTQRQIESLQTQLDQLEIESHEAAELRSKIERLVQTEKQLSASVS